MADYYHEARKAKRALKEVSMENKRRREERREAGLEDDGTEHPLNRLQIFGRSCKLHRNAEQYAATEKQDGLIPWNGDANNLIDRFDARSLLDFYREPTSTAPKPRTAQEEKLHELLMFESYRDLVALIARGMSEETGLKYTSDENLAIRAARRGAAAAALRVQSHQSLPGDQSAAGMYSAVGFSYGAATAAASDSSSSGEDDSDDDGDDDDGATPAANSEQAAAEQEQDRLDGIAELYHIKDFSYRLHRAQVAEGDADEAWRWKPRKRTGRKAARARARRMAGQGLDPSGKPLSRDWKDPLAMNAPSSYLIRPRRPSPEGGRGRSRSRSRSRSSSPHRDGPGLMSAIPSVRVDHIDRKAFERGDDDIVDALPDMPDPAAQGTHHFPINNAMHALRQAQEAHQQNKRRSRSRSRSRSRDRDRRRWRERDRRRSHSRSRSRSRSRDRHSYSRDRDRDRDRGRERDREAGKSSHSHQGSRSQQNASLGAGTSTASRTGSGGLTAVAAGPNASKAEVKETPQERLKRIMAAQLSKQLLKDSTQATQKKIQAEKEKAAREQIQRQMHRTGSPPRRGRSPSPSRDRYY